MQETRKKKYLSGWRLHVAVGVLLLLSILVTAYVVILNSQAYALANTFVESSNDVKAVVGTVKSQRLGVNYLRFKFSGTYDEMRFSIHVTGERDTAEIVFEMSRPQDAWRIDSATLRTGNGKQVQLHPTSPPSR